MISNLRNSECFQEALIVETKVRESKRGKGIKSLIAKKARVSRPTLNKFYTVENVGDDAMRTRIAKAFNYPTYEDFINIGKRLIELKPLNEEDQDDIQLYKDRLQQARNEVFQQLPIEINDDATYQLIEKLYDLSESGRQEVLAKLQKVWEQSWVEKLELNKLPLQPDARFKSIVTALCKSNGLLPEQLFTWGLSDILVQYIQHEINDFELIEIVNSAIRRKLFFFHLDKIEL